MSEMNSVGRAICHALGLHKAVAGVAASHDGGCSCTTCLAARGDNSAMTAIVTNLMLKDQEFFDAA